MREKIKKPGIAIVLLAVFINLFFPEAVAAKKKTEIYTSLVHDYKMVKIKVPDKDFLTDNWNYSLHFKSDKDRWAVQTTVFTRVEDAENPDFQPAQKFLKGKTIHIGEKYYIDVEMKGLSYKVTLSFTKKYKKFFEGLQEKDFIVEKDKGKEAYKNTIQEYIVMGLSKEYIKNEVLPNVEFNSFDKADKLDTVKKMIKKFKLKEAYDKKTALKRHKAGILLAEVFSAEEIEISLTRLLFAYHPQGYDVEKLDKEEEYSYLELKKGKKIFPIIFVHDGLKSDKKKEKDVEGTNKTIAYILQKPLQTPINKVK